jgi:hypothetical protein
LLTDKENGKKLFKIVMQTDELLKFNQFQGLEKGRMIRDFKESFLKNHCHHESKSQILKGKSPRRILWELISLENAEVIIKWINKFLIQK